LAQYCEMKVSAVAMCRRAVCDVDLVSLSRYLVYCYDVCNI